MKAGHASAIVSTWLYQGITILTGYCVKNEGKTAYFVPWIHQVADILYLYLVADIWCYIL
jgi:hypothetical protein